MLPSLPGLEAAASRSDRVAREGAAGEFPLGPVFPTNPLPPGPRVGDRGWERRGGFDCDLSPWVEPACNRREIGLSGEGSTGVSELEVVGPRRPEVPAGAGRACAPPGRSVDLTALT